MAGFEGALPLDAFDVCAANPAREHVAEPDAALKLVEELSNGASATQDQVEQQVLRRESREGHRREARVVERRQRRGCERRHRRPARSGGAGSVRDSGARLAKASGYGDAKRSRVTALDVSDNALGQKGL